MDKYKAIIQKLQSYQLALTNDYYCGVDMCLEYDYPAESVCDNDGDEVYFYRDAILPMKNLLNNSVNKTTAMLTQIQTLNNLTEISSYASKIRLFSASTFGQFSNQSSIVKNITSAFNSTKDQITKAVTLFNDAKGLKAIIGSLFADGQEVAASINGSLGNVRQWTIDMCLGK